MTKDDLDMTGESVCVLALFGGNRGNGSKCGLSYWNVNNPATNVNTNIVASQSYQNYGAFNQKHTFFLHRRVLKYT